MMKRCCDVCDAFEAGSYDFWLKGNRRPLDLCKACAAEIFRVNCGYLPDEQVRHIMSSVEYRQGKLNVE